jgi:hypothetical protein
MGREAQLRRDCATQAAVFWRARLATPAQKTAKTKSEAASGSCEKKSPRLNGQHAGEPASALAKKRLVAGGRGTS